MRFDPLYLLYALVGAITILLLVAWMLQLLGFAPTPTPSPSFSDVQLPTLGVQS